MADPSSQSTGGHPIADRRTKLQRLRCELDIDPYGRRVDGLIDLTAARSLFDHAKEADERSAAAIAGRVVLNRNIGKLIFMTLRDHTGDLQIALSKKAVDELSFKLARLTDLGDIVVARGRIGKTKTGEITLWVMALDQEASYEIACKSLAPPPEKWKGLVDPELRYRRRYVDMYVDPQVMTTFRQRSRIIKATRDFLADPPEPLGPGFIEVETPMMQPVAGGAAARPFTTHHNALDMDLFMRIAPELYLKRLLVGGMGRVFEINRNFRNEGIDRKHNPEFTMLELYQAFGDYQTMMQLTEMLIHTLAVKVCDAVKLPFDDLEIDYDLPFTRATYHDLFEQHNGFAAGDHTRLVEKAGSLGIAPQDKAHDVLLNEVWEATVEQHLIQPTFVMDYPASLCPLTRQKVGRPDIAERFELFIASMELANAYSELNDPDVQQANFQQQEADLDEKQATFRTMDHDFIESLKVGMPPAGGLGIGIDRLVMLLTNHRSIRDVILFPLLRPATGG